MINVASIASAVTRNDVSRQLDSVDAFEIQGLSQIVLSTPYSLKTLANIYEQSNILPQCIEAMVTNVAKYGFRVVPVDPQTEMDQRELETLTSFIHSANTEESLTTVHSGMVRDYEKYGYGFLEIIRDRSGRVSLLRRLRSYNVRLIKKDEEPFPVDVEILRGGKRRKVREYRRFRRYLQVVNEKKVFFKEFGDPRQMDYRTGEFATNEKPVPPEYLATEVLHRKQESEDDYGVPRWISQLPSIFGSREAEEVNLRYFEDNTVPPMILTVAGGRLTRESFLQLQKLLQARGVGKDRQNQIILIEAIPESSGIDDKGSVSLKIDKLADVRPSDGLFKDYDQANIAKVRSSFRLPPVAIGLSENVTYASANVSAYISESQVFLPERNAHDEFLNKRLINHPAGLNFKTVRLESRGPTVTNPDQVVSTLTAVNVMGGVTPRSAIDIINETMQLSLPQYPERGEEEYEEWMDTPMPIAQRMVMAEAKTQQTGEGESTHDMQGAKDQEIKDREKDGKTGVDQTAVEHGKE
jgi:PBSX family phage portal protein